MGDDWYPGKIIGHKFRSKPWGMGWAQTHRTGSGYDPPSWYPLFPAIHDDYLRDRYEGSGTNSLYRFMCGSIHFDATTDIAEFLALVKEAIYLTIGNMRTRFSGTSQKDEQRRKDLDMLSDAELEDLAYRIIYGAQILVEMALDTSLRCFCVKYTKSDTTGTSPYLSPTRTGFVSQLTKKWFHPLSIAIAEILTIVHQMHGPEARSVDYGCYFTPLWKSLTSANMEALISTMDAQYGAVDAARILGSPLMRIPEKWFDTIRMVPYSSGLSQMITFAMPNRDDAGLEDHEFDSVIASMYVHQFLGIGEEFQAVALFRDSGAVATPGVIKSNTPAAGKVAIKYLGAFDSTSFTDYVDTGTGFDWLYNIAAVRSAEQTGNFGKYVSYMTVVSDWGAATAAGFNSMLARWMSNHFYRETATIFTYSPHKIIPDLMLGFLAEDRSVPMNERSSNQSPLDSVSVGVSTIAAIVNSKSVRKGLVNQARQSVMSGVSKIGKLVQKAGVKADLKNLSSNPGAKVKTSEGLVVKTAVNASGGIVSRSQSKILEILAWSPFSGFMNSLKASAPRIRSGKRMLPHPNANLGWRPPGAR